MMVQEDANHFQMAGARGQGQSGVAEAIAHQGMSPRLHEKRDRLVVARVCSDEQERSAIFVSGIR